MSGTSLFSAADDGKDIGLTLLGQLTAAADAQATGGAEPLKAAVQQMLSVYSSAVLVIAGFIVLYQVILTIVDAAQTGKLFRRMNPVWGPLRLIIAIGLLVPLHSGMNSGQMIVIQVAEWGNGLASQLWSLAMRDIGTIRPMIVTPTPPPSLALVRALVLRDSCVSYTSMLARRLQDDQIAADEAALAAKLPVPEHPPLPLQIVGVLPTTSNTDGSQTTPYGWALRPYFCGAVSVFPADPDKDPPLFYTIKQAHLDALQTLQTYTEAYSGGFIDINNQDNLARSQSPNLMAAQYEEIMQQAMGRRFLFAIDTHVDTLRQSMMTAGWVGAPSYLDTILRFNVRLLGLTASLPQVDPPELMLNPPLPPSTATAKPSPEFLVYQFLQKVDASWGETPLIPPQSAAGLGGVTAMLSRAVTVAREVNGPGSTGHQLRSVRDILRTNDFDWASFGSGAPLVSLARIGAYLTGKSVELLAGAGILNAVGPVTEPTVWLLTLLGCLAFLASTGILLLLPLIPLVRFMIGLAAWMLQVFEALIAVPLVALAHLKGDEDGLAGRSAVLCYLMVLQITLRPALMIFGLLGGLIVFLLLLGAINQLVALAMPAILDSGQIASLWFVLVTATYAVLILGLANASFKLVSWLPDRTMTWLSGVVSPAAVGAEAPSPAVTSASQSGPTSTTPVQR